MILKTIQWNIGGGKVRKDGDDPMDPLVYSIDALDEVIEVLKKYNPDIITIQECHIAKNKSQIKEIAEKLGMKSFIDDIYDQSHIENDRGLGQAIISHFSIKNHKFELFYNPKLETKGPRGEHWISHDKGVSSCFIDIGDGREINIKTSHSFPYRRFNISPSDPEMLPLKNDMAEKLSPEGEIFLYQGDLNYNEYSLKELFPDYFKNGVKEVILDSPTTPKGRKYDHIIYKNLTHVSSKIITDVLTDHFPIYSEFKLK